MCWYEARKEVHLVQAWRQRLPAIQGYSLSSDMLCTLSPDLLPTYQHIDLAAWKFRRAAVPFSHVLLACQRALG